VSLVGYTNTGKSTLFNRLTDANVYVADQLFATLDPTMRRVRLPVGGSFVLVDTVGFVRDLPHELVAAFQSTLEETTDAELILHVVDCADPTHRDRIEDVGEVLAQIGATECPVIQVYNKTDILGVPPRVDRAEDGTAARVWLSAAKGQGIDILLDVITDALHRDIVIGTVRLDVSQARLRALLYERATVVDERVMNDGSWELDVEIDQRGYQDLRRQENLQITSTGDDTGSVVLH
jgi:GTP-binding protein HflX